MSEFEVRNEVLEVKTGKRIRSLMGLKENPFLQMGEFCTVFTSADNPFSQRGSFPRVSSS